MKNDNAVSPVIGVMLMLVVVIIIAAVVAAFAGGMSEETKKSPQVSISADYSQVGGLKLYHNGGDNINTANAKIYVAPSADFGSYEQLRWEVNTLNVIVQPNDLYWYNTTLASKFSVRFFQAGDYATAAPESVQPKTYSSSSNDSTSGYYGFANAKFLGYRFNLMLVDSDGRTIGKTEVKIKS